MDFYQYQPLERQSDIRVLQLDPASDLTDPLSATLVHVDLDDDAEYDALSYTWGSPELCRWIILDDDDGAGLAITANLDLALRRIRARQPPDVSTLIWADGICINQRDVPERNSQVRLMGRIYSQCLSGLIYLGEEADGSQYMPGFVKRLIPGVFSEEAQVENFHDNPLLPGLDDPGWKALHALLERPWFLRVWIIQEFALPPDIRMICGDWELDGDLIPQLTKLPTLNHSRQAMAGLIFADDSDFTVAWVHQQWLLRSRASLGHDLAYDDALRKEAIGLIELLWGCRHCKATDPRDHYFGLLGLAPDVAEEPALAADYLKPLKDVAIDYGHYFIKSGLGLGILYSSNDVESFDENIPSWVPNLTHNAILGDKMWTPLESEQIGVSIALGGIEDRSLMVSGCLLDSVAVLHREKNLESRDLSRWRDNWIQEIDSLVAGSERYASGQDIEEAVCRTIIANTSLDGERPAPTHYYQLYLLCRKSHRPSRDDMMAVEPVEAPLDMELFDMAVAMLATSRFCVTQFGFFGMVPRDSRAGDMIFTIRGDEQRAMFVVRKDDAGDGYKWVGHAYVHDIWKVREYEKLAWDIITVD